MRRAEFRGVLIRRNYCECETQTHTPYLIDTMISTSTCLALVPRSLNVILSSDIEDRLVVEGDVKGAP